jgi:hypothetical protein
VLTDVHPEPPPRKPINTYAIVSTVVFVLAAAYVGGVFFVRWHQNRAIEERAAAAKRDQDQQTFEGMGGNRFDILGFYAQPSVIHRGDETTLCYSVSNAKSVTLEPQTNAVWPAFERCVNVTPKKTTTYTFTATDAAGHTKTATVTVEVH